VGASSGRPRGMHFNDDHTKLYVACGYASTIDIIDVARLAVVGRLFTPGPSPEVVCICVGSAPQRSRWRWRGGRLAGFAPGRPYFALAPARVGVLFGQWLRERTHPAVFVRLFAVGLLLIGLDLALRNLT
jgi:hypothetical protein